MSADAGRRSRAAPRSRSPRGPPDLLVGGTGLYARAFAGGLIEGVGSAARVRAELEARSSEDLRAELEAVDAAAAARIARGDRVRTVRALEVLRLAKRRLSDEQSRHRFGDRPFDLVWLGLAVDRDRHAARLRVRAMFAWDCRRARRAPMRALAPDLRPLRAIATGGQRCTGDDPRAQAIELAWIATRRYAKRQRTWFRAEPSSIGSMTRASRVARVLRELSCR
jgi:tRNA dimethylallyltransferase